ncbi:MAG: hypothetical protein GX096_03805 [Clostridiales bacterium]|nr:hypothetical protein [Clostridiales bacterium]
MMMGLIEKLTLYFNMALSPDDYMGKTVKMSGTCDTYQATSQELEEQMKPIYLSCTAPDVTGCCARGLEFVLGEARTYPEDYPALGNIITIVGKFQMYEEHRYRYCELVDAGLSY